LIPPPLFNYYNLLLLRKVIPRLGRTYILKLPPPTISSSLFYIIPVREDCHLFPKLFFLFFFLFSFLFLLLFKPPEIFFPLLR